MAFRSVARVATDVCVVRILLSISLFPAESLTKICQLAKFYLMQCYVISIYIRIEILILGLVFVKTIQGRIY